MPVFPCSRVRDRPHIAWHAYSVCVRACVCLHTCVYFGVATSSLVCAFGSLTHIWVCAGSKVLLCLCANLRACAFVIYFLTTHL